VGGKRPSLLWGWIKREPIGLHHRGHRGAFPVLATPHGGTVEVGCDSDHRSSTAGIRRPY
jgi:hypothetical protein